LLEKSTDSNASFEPVTIVLEPLRTVTESNSGGHWRTRYRRGKKQRELVYYTLRHLLVRPTYLPLPLTITLTRLGRRMMDHDNLVSSMKHITDGVVDFVLDCPGEGHKHDNDPRLTWRYQQRKAGVSRYGVEIRFEARAEPSQGEAYEA
jgi:hypothetical protein